jgi:hypothetical protein
MFRIGMTVNKKTEKINNEIKEQAAFSFNVVGVRVKLLTLPLNGTVQPVALLRLPAPDEPPENMVTMSVPRFTAYADASSEGYKVSSISVFAKPDQ